MAADIVQFDYFNNNKMSLPCIRLHPIYSHDLIYHYKGQKSLNFNILSNVNSAGENYDSKCFVAEKNKKCHTEK